MLCFPTAVSTRPWQPIFNVRGRPVWVQTTVFDLLKQLKALRNATVALPSIDTINFSVDRQLRVPFGDLDALCDSIEYVLTEYGALGVAYGGPDDRGTLWISFYKLYAADRTRDNQLQFIIWVNSSRYPTVTLEENIQSVYEHIASQGKRLETSFGHYQQHVPYPPTQGTQIEALGQCRQQHGVGKYLGGKSGAPNPRRIDQIAIENGRGFPAM